MAEPQQHHPDPADVEGFDPEVGENDKPSRRINLNTVQIGAGAAASVTSALAASFFGVAGTLIGAAVGSIVSTVAAAIYADSMRRAADRVRVTQAIVVQKVVATGAVPTFRVADEAPTRTLDQQASPPTTAHPAVTVPVQHQPTEPVQVQGQVGQVGQDAQVAWWRRRPIALIGMMLLGFVIALGVVTGIEKIGHGTLSGDKGGTSVGRLFGETGTSTDDSTPTETPTSSSSVSPSATSSTEASQAPVAPTASATTAPSTTAAPTSEPTASATTAPSASAPAAGSLTGSNPAP